MRRTKPIAMMLMAPLAIALLIDSSGCYGGYAAAGPEPDGQVVVVNAGYGDGGYNEGRGGGDDRGRGGDNDGGRGGDSHPQAVRGGPSARPAAVTGGRKEPSKQVRPSESKQASSDSDHK
jgi:hypothetical protein